MFKNQESIGWLTIAILITCIIATVVFGVLAAVGVMSHNPMVVGIVASIVSLFAAVSCNDAEY